MKLLPHLLAACCLLPAMALGDSEPTAAVISPEDKVIVDALADYGVDLLGLVDPSEFPQLEKRSLSFPAVIAVRTHVFCSLTTAKFERREIFY